jgi:RNA polymerase-binding transcription factor DksA
VSSTKKATAARKPAKKAPTKKAPAKKTVRKAAPARKAPTKKAAAKKTPAKKVAPARKAAAAKAPAKKVAPPAKKVAPAKKAPAPAAAKKAAPARKLGAPAKPAAPPRPVRPTRGPYASDTKFLEEMRTLLLEEREVYQRQADDLRAEAESLALDREPGDVQFDEESGEGGTVTVDRERNLALSGQATLAVEEIDDAVKRIADKTYGYCERCFQPIPKPRLRALPYARLCVACKSGGLSRR